MPLNYLNGITKVIGHIKVIDNTEAYEPAIYIINEHSPRFNGRSFIIALSAMQKYVQPFLKFTDPKLITDDNLRFTKLRDNLLEERKKIQMGIGLLTKERVMKSNADLECLIFAETLCKSSGILLITGYNLAQCMRMFEITPTPAAAAQLLLFIEDSLDDMKNAPMPFPDKVFHAGGITLMDGSTKIHSGDWLVSETDVLKERYIQ
jgi:hypothetical protein